MRTEEKDHIHTASSCIAGNRFRCAVQIPTDQAIVLGNLRNLVDLRLLPPVTCLAAHGSRDSDKGTNAVDSYAGEERLANSLRFHKK